MTIDTPQGKAIQLLGEALRITESTNAVPIETFLEARSLMKLAIRKLAKVKIVEAEKNVKPETE